MKTINGNNKLERLINKSKKYLGIDLVKQSNKFLQVENKTYSNDIFVISTNQTYNSKNGEWLIIKPLNWKFEPNAALHNSFIKTKKDENVIGYVWEGNKVQKLKWQ